MYFCKIIQLLAYSRVSNQRHAMLIFFAIWVVCNDFGSAIIIYFAWFSDLRHYNWISPLLFVFCGEEAAMCGGTAEESATVPLFLWMHTILRQYNGKSATVPSFFSSTERVPYSCTHAISQQMRPEFIAIAAKIAQETHPNHSRSISDHDGP